ncbi:hypothetical protein [Nocardia aurea]|uniref:hypothetical protein n=1 Tax=Nocardia aurea TaxID=2144174 RepID=UPI0033AF6F22
MGLAVPAPMLANPDGPTAASWYAEMKFDGVRAIVRWTDVRLGPGDDLAVARLAPLPELARRVGEQLSCSVCAVGIVICFAGSAIAAWLRGWWGDPAMLEPRRVWGRADS